MPPKKRSTRASKKAKAVEEKPDEELVEPEDTDAKAQELKPKRSRTKSRRLMEADQSLVEEESILPAKSVKMETTTSKSKPVTKNKEGVQKPITELQQEQQQQQQQQQPEPTDEKESSTPLPKKRAHTDPTPQSLEKKQRKGRKPALEPSKPSPTRLLSPVRKISASSRIPSPVKRSSVAPKLDETRSTLNQAFLSRNLMKLNQIIDDLRGSRSEQLLNDYRNSVETRLKTSDDLVSSLTAQNHQLSLELEQLRSGQQVVASPVKATSEDDLFENELILDMMEQIVGLRIHKAEDQDDMIFFDCSQSGKNGILDYRLTIAKEDSSELLYTPIDTNNDQEALKEYLPDYFFDNLTFPLETLQQFYHKIYRGLNK